MRNEKRTSSFNGPVAKLYKEIHISTFFHFIRYLLARFLSLTHFLFAFSHSLSIFLCLALSSFGLIIQECLHKRTYVLDKSCPLCMLLERKNDSPVLVITSVKMSGQKIQKFFSTNTCIQRQPK